MSDTQNSDNTIANLLGTTFSLKNSNSYTNSTPTIQRQLAVTTALEVIRAKASAGSESNLYKQMENLSSFADLIQEALKVNDE